ncbi:MAG: biotin synthase BioB [Pseudomonadota bacterium]|nr:biotin synthase BioB [Pseudomonadota bacterium]
MTELRHDWSLDEVVKLYEQPFNDLLFQAHSVHRDNFDPNAVQMSTLLSIKTGGCPEDCAYCPQSVHYDTGVDAHPLLPVEDVVAAAKRAKEAGATRFCMGAAWRKPTNRQVDQVAELIEAVRDEGMDTCVTLGMLTEPQAQKLKTAGLDYYNHNLDTSPDLYDNIITTRTYQDRLETLQNVRDAGMNVCCGGIVGMGEDNRGRMGLLIELANLPEHPESVPINMLVQVEGTPLHGTEELDIFEFIRTVAVARILMPHSFVRLSAGRTDMTAEAQALCFFAGANSVFSGDKLLTTPNPEADEDQLQLQKLGIRTYKSTEEAAPQVNRAVSG